MSSARFPELQPQPSHIQGRATHTHTVWGNVLYNASLWSLVFLVSVVLLASGYDVLQQVIVVGRGNIRFADTAITGGGYVAVGIISTLVAFSRLYSVRQVLGSIPKAYIPTGRGELNKNSYRLVASEYTRCAMIVHAARPKGRVLPGWGDPSSDYAGMRFRTAILDTLQMVDAVVPASLPSSSQSPIPTSSRHASPLAKYLPLLEGENAILSKSLLPLLGLYEKKLEDAKWKLEEPTQEDYETSLRIATILVDTIQKRTKAMADGA